MHKTAKLDQRCVVDERLLRVTEYVEDKSHEHIKVAAKRKAASVFLSSEAIEL